MSVPMTPRQYRDQLEKWGLNFEGWGDWTDHNRNHKGEWGDVNGVMLHHTGPFSSNRQMLNLLRDGYSTLPGPLCHAANDTNGKVFGIGWGRANHAGLGDDEVFRNVVTESYGDYPGHGQTFQANTDGNSHFYGMEVIHSGFHHMDNDQYVTMVLWSAAILDFHGWTEKSVIGHGEWQPGKWDPGYKSGKMMDMAAVRFDIKSALAAGPGNWPKKPESEPEPEPESETGVYTVEKGDTLWSIAEKFLGSGKRWPEIVTANPQLLEVGDELVIPEK